MHVVSKIKDRLNKLSSQSHVRRSTRNAVFSAADHALLPILWLIGTPIFLNRLGTDMYGIWMLATGLIGIGQISSLGLTDGTVKFVAAHRSRNNPEGVTKVIETAGLLYTVAGLLAGATLAALAPLLATQLFNVLPEHQSQTTLVFRLTGAAIFSRYLMGIHQSALHGFERYDLAARVTMLSNTATMGLNIALAMSNFGVPALIVSTIALQLAAALAMTVVLRCKLAPHIHWIPRLHIEALKEMKGFCLFLWLQSALGTLGQNLDRMLLGATLSPSVIAYYAVAQRLAGQVHMLLSRAFAFLFPLAGGLHEAGNQQKLQQLYHRSTQLVIILSSAMTIPLLALGRDVLQLWVGNAFAEQAATALFVFCIRSSFLPLSTLTSILLNLAGMAILIPLYGATGAALGLMTSLPVMLYARIRVSRTLFGETRWRTSLSYLIPVLAPIPLGIIIAMSGIAGTGSLTLLLLNACVIAGLAMSLTWLACAGCRYFAWIPRY